MLNINVYHKYILTFFNNPMYSAHVSNRNVRAISNLFLLAMGIFLMGFLPRHKSYRFRRFRYVCYTSAFTSLINSPVEFRIANRAARTTLWSFQDRGSPTVVRPLCAKRPLKRPARKR